MLTWISPRLFLRSTETGRPRLSSAWTYLLLQKWVGDLRKIKTVRAAALTQALLLDWGGGGMFHSHKTHLKCAVMLLNHAPRVTCTVLARLQVRIQAILYFSCHWNSYFRLYTNNFICKNKHFTSAYFLTPPKAASELAMLRNVSPSLSAQQQALNDGDQP